jgi:putative spermidine/putrescine transport system substrate-binding protein
MATQRRIHGLLGALGAGMLTAGLAHADMTVISFGGAVQKAQTKAYYEPIAKTGTKVIAGEYNGEQAKIKAMVDTKNVTWDVVEVESAELARGCEEGLFEKLDYTKIGDKKDFIGAAVTDCGVGTFIWSTVLAYNADKIKTPPASWAEFWDVRSFRASAECAKAPNSRWRSRCWPTASSPRICTRCWRPRKVSARIQETRPVETEYPVVGGGAQPPQLLAAGDLVMSSAYNGRIATAQKEGKNLKIVWAGNISTRSLGDSEGTPKRDEAYKYIKFASQPENQKVFQ